MKGRKANPNAREAQTDPARRRRSKAARAAEAAEQRAQLAQARAAQFAQTQTSIAMPPWMAEDAQYAGAAAVWRFYEQLLRERHFLEAEYIVPFTGFCIYADEFLAADREVKAKGWGVEGKSTSGGDRFWLNPAVSVRDHAFSRVLELSTRFGFTALDLYKLERESAAAAGIHRTKVPKAAGPAASDQTPQPGELPLEPDAPAEGAGPGALTAFDSEPPAKLN